MIIFAEENNNDVNWISNLEHMTYEIPYLGSVTMFFIFCFGIGFVKVLKLLL